MADSHKTHQFEQLIDSLGHDTDPQTLSLISSCILSLDIKDEQIRLGSYHVKQYSKMIIILANKYKVLPESHFKILEKMILAGSISSISYIGYLTTYCSTTASYCILSRIAIISYTSPVISSIEPRELIFCKWKEMVLNKTPSTQHLSMIGYCSKWLIENSDNLEFFELFDFLKECLHLKHNSKDFFSLRIISSLICFEEDEEQLMRPKIYNLRLEENRKYYQLYLPRIGKFTHPFWTSNERIYFALPVIDEDLSSIDSNSSFNIILTNSRVLLRSFCMLDFKQMLSYSIRSHRLVFLKTVQEAFSLFVENLKYTQNTKLFLYPRSNLSLPIKTIPVLKNREEINEMIASNLIHRIGGYRDSRAPLRVALLHNKTRKVYIRYLVSMNSRDQTLSSIFKLEQIVLIAGFDKTYLSLYLVDIAARRRISSIQIPRDYYKQNSDPLLFYIGNVLLLALSPYILIYSIQNNQLSLLFKLNMFDVEGIVIVYSRDRTN